ncbi:MAG TPA: methyltransferase type 12, partial [Trueperaceae bacterium]|nr:methyltransferase type 12 [Trueperaceae bacterium]
MKILSEHWNSIFSKTDSDKLGWYESDFEQTIKFLKLIPNWQDSKIFVSGAGTTGLVDLLLQENCQLVLN